MNDDHMYSEEPVMWSAEDFHSWLMEEAFRFRKVHEGPNYEFIDEEKTCTEWGKLFREWLNDNI